MPVDADALDQIARGVTESLARGRRPERQAELDEHARTFAAAIAAGKAVLTLADAAAPPPARRRALEMALRDLFEGLARRGRLSGALKQLVILSRPHAGDASPGRRDPGSGEVERAQRILRLCALARSGPGAADPDAVSRMVQHLIGEGRLGAELRWFLNEGLFTSEELAGWLQGLGRSARRRLMSSLRAPEASPVEAAYPFVPRALVGTALAAGPGASGGGERPPGSAAGSPAAQRVDAAVRAAARSAPTLAAYRAMRADRRRLDEDGWAGAAQRFQEATAGLVSMVMELEAAASTAPAGWDRGAVEKRIESVAQRQDRVRATLPQLRAEYHRSIDAYLASEAEWKRVFKAQVLEAARTGAWDEEAIAYLGGEYPQLAAAAPEAGGAAASVAARAAAPVPPASPAPPPPPASGGAGLPRAPTPPGLPVATTDRPAVAAEVRPAAPAETPVERPAATPAAPSGAVRPAAKPAAAPPEPGTKAPSGAGRGLRRPPAKLLAAMGPVALMAGALVGFGLGGSGTQPPRPAVAPTAAVTTVATGRPLPGNHVILHLKALTAKDGATLGPYDETDGAGTVECTPNLTRFLATTMTGITYEVRAGALDTVVNFGGDRASVSGAPLPSSGAGIAEGGIQVNDAAKLPAGTLSVQGSCPGAPPVQVTMARAIPSGLAIEDSPATITPGVDPGPAGIVAALVLVAAGGAMVVRGRPRSDLRLVISPALLLAGGLLLGFATHRTMVSGEAAPLISAQARTPGCADCPDGIRLLSTEVQARPGSTLFIFRGLWPASPGVTSSDLRLVASGLEVVLRPRQDPAGYQLVSASRAGAPVPAEGVAVGLRPGVLLVDLPDALVSRPLHFEFGVWKAGAYVGRVPAAGDLVWDGRGAPRGSPASAPGASPSPSAGATPTAPPAPTVAPVSPTASPAAAALDVTSLAAGCPALKAGPVAADLVPSSIVAGVVPDLVTSAPAHYFGVYFDRAAFSGDLAGHAPFSVTLAVQRAGAPGTGPHPIDRVGNIQLWAYWDGKALHRGVRTFAAGAWTMKSDDAASELPSVEVRRQGLVFYWNGVKPGDKAGTVAADSHGCSPYGIGDGVPAIGVA